MHTLEGGGGFVSNACVGREGFVSNVCVGGKGFSSACVRRKERGLTPMHTLEGGGLSLVCVGRKERGLSLMRAVDGEGFVSNVYVGRRGVCLQCVRWKEGVVSSV